MEKYNCAVSDYKTIIHMEDIMFCFYCKENNAQKVIKLLEKGANPNGGISDDTFLHHAAGRNAKDCMKILIEAGANVNAINDFGNTPLHIACRHDSRDCLKLLLEAGACPYIENKTGKTPLECIEDEQLRREMEEYAIACSTLHIKEPSC